MLATLVVPNLYDNLLVVADQVVLYGIEVVFVVTQQGEHNITCHQLENQIALALLYHSPELTCATMALLSIPADRMSSKPNLVLTWQIYNFLRLKIVSLILYHYLD